MWLFKDETTNTSRWSNTNVNGVLKNNQMVSEKSFLLSCQGIPTVKHNTITCVFNEATQTLV